MKDNSDLLEGKLTCVDYPSNMTLIECNEEYPYGSVIYKMVKGNPLNPKSLSVSEQDLLAKKIVEFNKEFHSLDIDWNRDTSINHEMSKIDRNIGLVEDFLSRDEIIKLKEYRNIFSSYLNSKEKFCITHGDLWADNLIVNENNELTGIIDFGNMSYFLPEVDYDSMWDMIDGFIDRLLVYTKEDVTRESIILFVMHRELCYFEYALEEEKSEQIVKIKKVLGLIEPIKYRR